MKENELLLQENFSWSRSSDFKDYNSVLAYFQAQYCLDYAKGDSLLDMPCGDGTITEILAPRFRTVFGVDASLKHLDEAKKKVPNGQFYHGLIEDMTLSQKFTTITMLNILEHVVDPVCVLKRAASFLDHDGVLIIHVPNSRAVNREIAVLMGTLESCEELSPFDIKVAGHRRSYDMDLFRQDILSSGLKISAEGGIFYKMLSTPQIDWFLKNGPWENGGFGWGRVGAEKRDWKAEFCRACYEYGKSHPTECNIISICATL